MIMATIYDIARTANVSHATVSMALRGIGKIRPETRERIMAIARDVGYRPNTNAVALKSGMSRMITMLHGPHPFSKISVELRNCARNDGYELSMIELELDPSRQRRSFELLLESNCAAAICYMTNLKPVEDLVEKFLAQRKPLVVLGPPQDWHPMPGLYGITMENLNAVGECIDLLLKLGHRHIAHTVYSGEISDVHRFLTEKLKAAGINDWDPAFHCELHENLNIFEQGYLAGGKLLEEKPGVTAIQCFSDRFAMGIMRRFYEMGVSVPGDISVIGSENDLFAEYNTISLSTIDTGGDLMGRRAWELLCRHLNDPALPLESFVETVHARFIPRESIGMVSEKSVFFKLRENIKQKGAAAKR